MYYNGNYLVIDGTNTWTQGSFGTAATNALTTLKVSQIQAENIEEEKGMTKTLFDVVVVDNTGKILVEEKVVSANRDEAIFDLEVHDVLRQLGLSLSDVTIIINSLGNVRIKEEK